MKRTKVLLFVMAIMLIVAGLAGCQNNSKTPEESTKPTDKPSETANQDEKIKITLYSLDWEDSLKVIVEDAYKEFREANPNVELEVMYDSHEAWATKVKTMMAGDGLPDMFVSQPSDLSVYAEYGAYADLTSYIDADQEWKDGFISGALNTMAVGDKIYGVPFGGYIEGVYYNTELFEKYNLEYPKTYAELVEVVKVFAANDVVSFAVGAKDGWPVTMTTHFLMDREAGYDYFKASMTDKEKTFENPMYVKAFDKMLELQKLGAFSKGVAGASHDDAITMFKQGKAAMFVDGNWEVGGFKEHEDGEFIKKVKFANFPTVADGQGVQNAACNGFGKSYCINNNISDAKKEACIKLFKIITSNKFADRYLEEAGYICGNKATGVDESKIDPIMVDVNNVVSQADQTWPAYGEFITPGFYDEMNKVGQQLLLGQITAEDAAKQMEKARLEYQLQ